MEMEIGGLLYHRVQARNWFYLFFFSSFISVIASFPFSSFLGLEDIALEDNASERDHKWRRHIWLF